MDKSSSGSISGQRDNQRFQGALDTPIDPDFYNFPYTLADDDENSCYTSDETSDCDADEIADTGAKKDNNSGDHRFRTLFSELFDIFDQKTSEIEQLRNVTMSLEAELKAKDMKEACAISTSTVQQIHQKSEAFIEMASEDLLKSQLSLLQTNNVHLNQEILKLKKENDQLKGNLEDVQDTLSVVLGSYASCNVGRAPDTVPLPSTTIGVQSGDAKYQNLEKECKDHRNRISEQAEQIKRLTAHIAEHDRRVSEYTDTINDLWNSLCSDRSRTVELEAQLRKEKEQHDSEVNQLKEDKTALELQLSLLLVDDDETSPPRASLSSRTPSFKFSSPTASTFTSRPPYSAHTPTSIVSPSMPGALPSASSFLKPGFQKVGPTPRFPTRSSVQIPLPPQAPSSSKASGNEWGSDWPNTSPWVASQFKLGPSRNSADKKTSPHFNKFDILSTKEVEKFLTTLTKPEEKEKEDSSDSLNLTPPPDEDFESDSFATAESDDEDNEDVYKNLDTLPAFRDYKDAGWAKKKESNVKEHDRDILTLTDHFRKMSTNHSEEPKTAEANEQDKKLEEQIDADSLSTSEESSSCSSNGSWDHVIDLSDVD